MQKRKQTTLMGVCLCPACAFVFACKERLKTWQGERAEKRGRSPALKASTSLFNIPEAFFLARQLALRVQ